MSDIFVKRFVCETGENFVSLTGGKYKIVKDKDLAEFYEHLQNDHKNKKPYYFVEKITSPFAFYVDVEKQKDDQNILIEDIAETYKQIINEFYNIDESQLAYYILYKESGCKDRAHIHFPQFYMKNDKKQTKFLKEKVDNILEIKDKKTIDASAYNTGLRMLGAKKPKDEKHPDKDTSAYITDNNILDFNKYSIRLLKGTTPHELKDSTILKPKKVKEEKLECNECLITDNNDLVEQLCSCISKERVDDYSTWIKLGILLRTLSKKNKIDYLNLYIKLSKQSTKYNPKENFKNLWANFESYDQMTIATLYYWAKLDNPIKYEELKKKSLNSNLKNAVSGSHDSIAKLCYFLYFNNYIVDKNETWYIFDNITGTWRKCLSSNKEIFDMFDYVKKLYFEFRKTLNKTLETMDAESPLKKIQIMSLLKHIHSLFGKLSTECFCNSVIANLTRKFQDAFVEFDTNPLLIGFNNGIYDLENKCFRIGKYDDFISMSVGYNFEPDRNLTKIKTLLSQIHPESTVRDYHLKVMSKSLDFQAKSLIVFCSGFQGANGKSFENNLRHLALGDYSIRAPCSLITADRESASSSNSSLVSLKNKRNIFFSEPNRKKKINTAFLKELTGGDLISGRELYKSQESFHVNGLISVAQNRDGDLDDIDGGVIRRVVKIRYSSRFVKNPSKHNEYQLDLTLDTEIVKKDLAKDYLNLLLEYYYLENIQIPQSVIDDTNEYLNSNNPIREFIDDYIVKEDDGILLKSELKTYYNNKFKRDYKYKEFVSIIEIELATEFSRDKNVNGQRYYDVMVGYKFKDDDNNLIEEEY